MRIHSITTFLIFQCPPLKCKRLRALEAQLAEEENLEIVRMVKAVHMDNKELTAFLRAYASGMISLPEGMMEREGTADPDMMEGTDDEE